MASFECRELRKSYGSAQALDGVSLQVGSGRILGLLGRTAPARPRS